MNSADVILAVYNLPLNTMEALYASLPRQIHFLKQANVHESKALKEVNDISDTIFKGKVNLFALAAPKAQRRYTRKETSARSLIEKYFSEHVRGTVKEIRAYCKAVNPKLTDNNIDSSSDALVKKGLFTKDYGTWTKVGVSKAA